MARAQVVATEPRELTLLRAEAGRTRFGRAAVARVEGMRLGVNPRSKLRDLDLPWVPESKHWRVATAMARRFLQAHKIATEAVGMYAKVDQGQRTRSGGRVLVCGTVIQATAAFRFRLGSDILYVLRLRDLQGRVWDERTKIMHIHRIER